MRALILVRIAPALLALLLLLALAALLRLPH